jgi:hypothetical protein
MIYSFGVRNPKIENQESILEYLKEKKLNTKNSFALRDTTALNKFNASNIGTPEIRFYDKNGYLMIYRNDKKCNAQNDSLIGFLNPKNVIKVDSSNNINDYIKQLKTLDGKDLNKKEFENYDYYLIMYWAKWTGKVNSIKMLDWENSLNQKNNLNIKTIKVTTDYMNFWELRKKDMVKVYSFRTKIRDEKNKK